MRYVHDIRSIGCTAGNREVEIVNEPDPAGDVADPAAVVALFASALRSTDQYREPTSGEQVAAVRGLDRLLDGPDGLDAATTSLAGVGFSRSTGVDTATDRPYALFRGDDTTGRGWGLIIVDLSQPVRLVIEVPHPGSDLETDQLGVRLFRRTPGALLLIAGAHRRAGNGAADVAHNADSIFDAMATEFAGRGLPQLQLHGYADKNLPDADVVVSTGPALVTPAVRRLAERLADAGLVTCRAWVLECGRLEGVTNVQGRTAADHGSLFVHLEMSYRVRRSARLQGAVAEAVRAADLTRP